MPLQVDYAAKKTIQIAITKYFPIWGEGQTLPVCLAIEAEWREDESITSALRKNACFCSVGGHPREEWPPVTQWFRQKNSEGTVEYSGRRKTVGR